MKKFITIAFLLAGLQQLNAQAWSAKMAQTVLTIWKDSLVTQQGVPVKWRYDQGVVLKGIESCWLRTGNKKYFDYIQKSMDFFVGSDGSIRTYSPSNYNLADILCGRNLATLYNVLENAKYYKATTHVRDQLRTQPRIKLKGFWHGKIYPWQMWLDDSYMAEPFYAEWAKYYHEDTAFNDVARQLILMEKSSRNEKTGLLYHGYDESRIQLWANKTTGRSPNVWGRGMAWYGMALVDALEIFPKTHPKRDTLVKIFNRFATAAIKYQDSATGLWWDIVDKPAVGKNYFEASASSIFVYTLAKGVRLGFLPATFLKPAQKGFDGILKQFVKTENGQTNLYGTVGVSRLGGNPYRDGSFDYYMSEKLVVNDPKGVGAFLMAANETELIPALKTGKGKTVMLDNYFNDETEKDITGATVPFHYVWDEMDNNGYSLFGNIFKYNGAKITTLKERPTATNLQKANVYLIVDPDTKKETANPNYVQPADVDSIYNWVNGGGVLALFSNDSANAEFQHFNTLSEKFGIHFNGDSKNHVTGNNFEDGAIAIPLNHPIFSTAKKVFIKELSTLKLSSPAKSVLQKGGYNIVAVAKVGKGWVFAVGDPWFYNEYLDGRRLPAQYENYKAATDLVKWLLSDNKIISGIQKNDDLPSMYVWSKPPL